MGWGRSGKDDRAPGLAKLLQQSQGRAAQGFCSGHDHHAVAHGSELQGGVGLIDGGVFCEVSLVAVVEVDLRPGQSAEYLGIGLLELLHLGVGRLQPFGAIDMDLRPDAFHRIDHQHIADRTPSLEHDMESAEVGFDRGVFRIPRGLERDAGREVALGLAGHGIPAQVVAAQVYAEERLPVADPFVVGEIRPPTGAAIQFREHPRPLELTRHGGQLFDHPETFAARAEDIDAGIIEIRVVAHHRAAGHGLRREGVFVQHVSGEQQPEFAAALVHRLGPVREEKPLADFHVGPLDRRQALPLRTKEKLGQPVDQIVTEGRGKSRR